MSPSRRVHSEAMSKYTRRLKEARRELEEVDESMYVSEKFFAWMLLRRSGLTAEEKSRVRGATHCSEDPRDLSFALKRLFPTHKQGLMAVQEKRTGNDPNRGRFRQAYVEKGVYGLCKDPRLWWRRLREVLVSLRFTELKMISCVFAYWACDQNGTRRELMGMLAVHVDDIIICGSVVFESVLTKLKQRLTFGKWWIREFTYLGRQVKQSTDFTVEISLPSYAEKIPAVPISREQIANDTQEVAEQTREDLRRTAGAACWMARSTRPDLSFEVSLLQQSLTEATYQTVKQANTLVKRASQFQCVWTIPGINLRKAVVVAVSDASPGKMPRQGSQGGMFLLISTPDITNKRVPAACMYWLSHRWKRVARSSMATESMALCEATEHGEFLRACFRELMDPHFDFKRWESCTLTTPLIAATDCRSAYDHITMERGLPKDCILALDLAALRATFESQLHEHAEGRAVTLRWLPGP